LKFLCLSAYECEIEYLPVPGQDNEEARDSKGSIQGENVGNFDAMSDIFTRKMDVEKGTRSLSNRFIEFDHVTDPSNESSEYVRGLDSKLKWSPPMRASMPAEIDELLGLNHSVGGPVTPSPRPRTRSKSRLEKGWSSRSMGDETSNSVTSKWNPKQESSLGLNLEADISGPVSQNHPKSPVFEDDKWVHKQGPFLGVMVCNHKCKTVQCAKSQTLAPNAKHDDKTLDLLLVHDIGRFQLLRFLVLMQFGCHLSLPFVECTKVCNPQD
jgi:sphingosine kinase